MVDASMFWNFWVSCWLSDKIVTFVDRYCYGDAKTFTCRPGGSRPEFESWVRHLKLQKSPLRYFFRKKTFTCHPWTWDTYSRSSKEKKEIYSHVLVGPPLTVVHCALCHFFPGCCPCRILRLRDREDLRKLKTPVSILHGLCSLPTNSSKLSIETLNIANNTYIEY